MGEALNVRGILGGALCGPVAATRRWFGLLAKSKNQTLRGIRSRGSNSCTAVLMSHVDSLSELEPTTVVHEPLFDEW